MKSLGWRLSFVFGLLYILFVLQLVAPIDQESHHHDTPTIAEKEIPTNIFSGLDFVNLKKYKHTELSENNHSNVPPSEDIIFSSFSQHKTIFPKVKETHTVLDIADLSPQIYNHNTPLYRSIKAEQQKKFALVIGNSLYAQVPSLKNPETDAKMVSQSLKRLGFEVIEGYNLTRMAVESLFRQFVTTLPSDSVALFYYAGHGVQITGVNLLIPVDAQLQNISSIEYDAIRLDNLVDELNQSPSRLNLFIIDACRDNPWRNLILENQSLSNYGSAAPLQGHQGLNNTGRGTLIAFATAENQLAADGDGLNSPYTSALLKWIEKPNLEIGMLFRKIREDVQISTNGMQIPWESGSITGEFYFNGNTSQEVASPNQNNEVIANRPERLKEQKEKEERQKQEALNQETLTWTALQKLQDKKVLIEGLQNYIKTYPEGQFVQLAKLQISDLEAQIDREKELAKSQPKDSSNGTSPKDPKVTTGEPASKELLKKVNENLPHEKKQDIQEALAILDFYDGPIDGEFDDTTYGAIFAYQQNKQFSATGYLSPKELVILFADAATKRKADPKIAEKIKKVNGPTWYVAATPEGELTYVYGVMGDPETTKIDGADDGLPKKPALNEEGGIKLLMTSQQATGEPAVTKSILARPDLDSWASNPPPAKGPAGTIPYRVVLNTVVYKQPEKYSEELGYLLPGSWVRISGEVFKKEWFQVIAPDGRKGFVGKYALAPKPFLVHSKTIQERQRERLFRK